MIYTHVLKRVVLRSRVRWTRTREPQRTAHSANANRVGLLLLRAGNRVDGSPTCNQSGSDHLRWP
jgi:hypothetical protein